MEFHSRKPTRIPGYDYSRENYYFVTICTHGKQCIFWTAGHLNMYGEIAKKDLQQIPEHFPNVRIDHYIVMPNHIHAIIEIQSVAKEEKRKSLDTVIGLYKSGVSKKIHFIFIINTIVVVFFGYTHYFIYRLINGI